MTEKRNELQDDSPVDIAALRAYCAGNEALVLKVLGAFLQVGPQYLNDLGGALQTHDGDEIRAQCHKIRGAGSIIKATPLLEAVSGIRESAIAENFDQAGEYFSDLEKAVADVIQFIEKLSSSTE